ncbi:MAG: hypothetical protein KGJ88_12175 [Verrucomicrobiota bacterium]|nr:hypothetical protein [Verrucomicrobiota bacterium]
MKFSFHQINSKQKQRHLVSFGKKNCSFAVLVAAACLFLLGCHRKGGDNPSKLAAAVTRSIIQGQWPGLAVKVSKISYESPVLSKGGRVPAGVKLFPAKVLVSMDGGPKKQVLFYFYQNAFGAWEAYTVSAKRNKQ